MPAKDEPRVSVVTPVHNGEGCLSGCIESVRAQTYSNWDLTIVNNASTDRTLEVARAYAAKDPRIHVHDNERFLRVIENYNNALRQISPASTYCKVVAADDVMFPECLEKMVRLAEEHPNVAIVGAYGLQGAHVSWEGLPHTASVVNGREICRKRLLGELYVFGTPTSLLYRSDVVRSRPAFFNESNLHSDSETCLEILEQRDFGFVHQVLTVQGVRPDSLTSFSIRMKTYLPGLLYEIVTYGPRFLSEAELARRIREQLHDYYRYLGAQAYRRRGREFWEYHRGKLEALGFPMSSSRVARAALAYAMDLALNPKRSIEGLARRMKRRRSVPREAAAAAELRTRTV